MKTLHFLELLCMQGLTTARHVGKHKNYIRRCGSIAVVIPVRSIFVSNCGTDFFGSAVAICISICILTSLPTRLTETKDRADCGDPRRNEKRCHWAGGGEEGRKEREAHKRHAWGPVGVGTKFWVLGSWSCQQRTILSLGKNSFQMPKNGLSQ
jgi:hypothetical protein